MLNPHLICNKFKPQNPDIIPPLHIPLNTHKICKFSEMKIDVEAIWGLFVFSFVCLLSCFLFLLLLRFKSCKIEMEFGNDFLQPQFAFYSDSWMEKMWKFHVFILEGYLCERENMDPVTDFNEY